MIVYSDIDYDLYKAENIQLTQDLKEQHQYEASRSVLCTHIPRLKTLLGTESKKKLLDVGCRMCDLFVLFVESGMTNIEYHGIDLSTQITKAVKDRYLDRVVMHSGDICSFLANGQYDIVFMRQTMQFLKSIPLAVQSIYCALKSDRFFYLVQSIPYELTGRHYNSVDGISDVLGILRPFFNTEIFQTENSPEILFLARKNLQ